VHLHTSISPSTVPRARALDKTVTEAKRLGLTVIAGDTDSVFLCDTTDAKLSDLTSWAKKRLRLDLDTDKRYRFILLSSRKKAYLGIHPDGTPDAVGLIGKKKDRPTYFKTAFDDMLAILQDLESVDGISDVRDRIIDLNTECKKRIANGDYRLPDLAYNVELTKDVDQYKTTPEYVKVAKAIANSGQVVGKGSLISYIKTVNGAKSIESATKSDVDVEKYCELLDSMFTQILEAMNNGSDENDAEVKKE